MKRVLVGGFVAESNAYVDMPCEIEQFSIQSGDDVAKALYIDELSKQLDVELVPSIHASGGGAGRVSKDAFDYIAKRILRDVKEHEHNIDGMFFFFHGASNVIDLEGGSGDHYLIREIRKIVGPYMPIAMVMDPHGNLSQEQADNCNIIRTFRHSPHTDRLEAHQIVFRSLIDVLNKRRVIHPEYRKVPILLGGERCVSTDEPLVSINKKLDEIEADPKIMCCSYHIGYLRHDNAKCGASVIVVPYMPEDKEYAAQKADEIAEYAFSKRKEFHFTGTALDPDEAIAYVMEEPQSPCFLTDSGDNVTAGAPGKNTYVLRQFLNLKDYKGKNILFAAIADPILCKDYLAKQEVGSHLEFDLGVAKDSLSEKVHVKGTLLSTGILHRHYGETYNCGDAYTVKLDDYPITIIIASNHVSFAERQQYEAANVDMDQYDLIIVKQGYLYPELKGMAKRYVMSLTDGATMQRTERLTYKTVIRPIFPLDDI